MTALPDLLISLFTHMAWVVAMETHGFPCISPRHAGYILYIYICIIKDRRLRIRRTTHRELQAIYLSASHALVCFQHMFNVFERLSSAQTPPPRDWRDRRMAQNWENTTIEVGKSLAFIPRCLLFFDVFGCLMSSWDYLRCRRIVA